MKTYTLPEALKLISMTIVVSPNTASNTLQRWIGERHIFETGRNPGSGNGFEYTEKDIRRAIAYLRLRRLVGGAIGSDARVVADRVREVASWHTDGFVLVTDKDVSWEPTQFDAQVPLADARAIVVIPCDVVGFNE